MTKIMLMVPRKNNCLNELRRLLPAELADIHVFPESFLSTDALPEALEIIRAAGAFVIAGYRDTSGDAAQEKALVIDRGEIIGEYAKCVLTSGEKRKGFRPGSDIHCIDTRFGKIGVPICYEIHFPEVARSMALENPALLVNTVGTGMFHDLQFSQWTALARARAIENEVHVVGCCHDTEGIPLAFAYRANGEILLEAKNAHDSYIVDLDLSESHVRAVGYFKNRVPEVFGKICSTEEIK